MRYAERNEAALSSLAPNTQALARKFYEYCKSNGIEILITEGRRTKATQLQYFRDKKSKTMRSYHLVGQAFDFVPVIDAKVGEISYNHYRVAPWIDAVNYAKALGFEWGGDWGWDSPHMQYKYKGYGTDTRLGVSIASIAYKIKTYRTLREGSTGADVKELQRKLQLLGTYTGTLDGVFGRGTANAVMIYQRRRRLLVDGIAGKGTQTDIDKLLAEKGAA